MANDQDKLPKNDHDQLAEWSQLIRATIGTETEALLREGGLSQEEVLQRLAAKGVNPKEIEEKMKGAGGSVRSRPPRSIGVPRPLHVPPMASPRVYRPGQYNGTMPYTIPVNNGFDCAGNRLPPVGPNGDDEMNIATGRVAHNLVCSHTGWTSSGMLDFKRASLVGVQVSITHNKPMTYWVTQRA